MVACQCITIWECVLRYSKHGNEALRFSESTPRPSFLPVRRVEWSCQSCRLGVRYVSVRSSLYLPVNPRRDLQKPKRNLLQAPPVVVSTAQTLSSVCNNVGGEERLKVSWCERCPGSLQCKISASRVFIHLLYAVEYSH